MPIVFKTPEERYIRSYWETLGEICAEGKYLALSEPFPYDVTVGFMKKIIDEKIPAVFVIDTENDRCIGWCDAVSADGKTGKLGMGILRPYREKGIGTKLLEAVKDRCAKNGYERIELKVWKSNIWAIHLYEKTGFVKTDEDKDTFTMSLDLKN